jgi:hypothetical protein
MAALTSPFPQALATERVDRYKAPVAAGGVVFMGASVAVDTKTGSPSRGFYLPAGTDTTVGATSDATGQVFRGRALETKDNTKGQNGALLVEIEIIKPKLILWRNNSQTNAVSVNDRGSPCYYEDDNTVGKLATGFSLAGLVWDYDATTNMVAVEVQ